MYYRRISDKVNSCSYMPVERTRMAFKCVLSIVIPLRTYTPKNRRIWAYASNSKSTKINIR